MTKNIDTSSVNVLIAASGSGQRFASDIPKQYCMIEGKAILRHTIERFLEFIPIKNIHVIINPDHRHHYDVSVQGLDANEPIEGSKTRKNSIYNGLKCLSHLKNKDKILFHDAVRPFFDINDTLKLLQILEHKKAASLCHKVKDTIFDIENKSYPDREHLVQVQTPQGFHYGSIYKAHKKFANQDGFTDDTSLILAMNEDIEWIASSALNFKITTQDDFKLAKAILAQGKSDA